MNPTLRKHLFRQSITLSTLVFLFSAFAFIAEKNIGRNYTKNKVSIAYSDTIKKVTVSSEYLKLLAGEYISTNETKARKIKFEASDGVLIGNDNGYVYVLVPVGDGKFINPEDEATLVFDTKNKAAITLLLFGTVNLKKVK